MNTAVIGVGSNIDPERNIARAKKRIAGDHRLIRTSSFVRTRPIGISDQPDFLNGVFLIETRFNRKSLRHWLQAMEDELKRDRSLPKYGPRTIDLDIVIWNGRVVDQDIYQRDFLKTAVLEVLPDLIL